MSNEEKFPGERKKKEMNEQQFHHRALQLYRDETGHDAAAVREWNEESAKVHRLKTRADCWDAVHSGRKRFEVRKNDRGFQVGDYVELVRLNDMGHVEADRVLAFRIGFILHGGEFGIEPGYCVLQLVEIDCVRAMEGR